MRRAPPDHRMIVPITVDVYQQLVGASIKTGFEKEDWEIAAEAIDEWMRRHHPDAIPLPAISGYQWKSVFLPDGTLLRTVFGGKNHHCLVQDDRILYNDQPVSPSGFVNAVGGIRRNAWRCTWVLLPDTQQWQLADTMRISKGARRPRRPTVGVQHVPSTAHTQAADVPVSASGSGPFTSASASVPSATTPSSFQAADGNASVPPEAASASVPRAAAIATVQHAAAADCVPSPGVTTSVQGTGRLIHAQTDTNAASLDAEKTVPLAKADEVQRAVDDGHALCRQQRTSTTQLPCRCRRTADRRGSDYEAPLPLLREEPFPPLDLLFGRSEPSPESRPCGACRARQNQ